MKKVSEDEGRAEEENQEEIVPKKKAKMDKKESKDESQSAPKLLIRPSKLGSFRSLGHLHSSSSPSDLIVEGKRQVKPSAKIQEQMSSSGVDVKKSITQYADAMATKSKSERLSNDKAEHKSSPSTSENHEKIQRLLASQWDSRLRKVDNKFVKTGRLSLPGSVTSEAKKPLLRESKLELNHGLLETLRNPSQQVQFYEAIQQSMQRPDKTPPKLLNSAKTINPGKQQY